MKKPTVMGFATSQLPMDWSQERICALVAQSPADSQAAEQAERFKTMVATIATIGGLALIVGTFALDAILR